MLYMRKILLSTVLLIFLAFQASLFAQNAKSKNVSEAPERTPIELSVAGNRIQVQNAPVGMKLEVYSVVGQKMAEMEIKSSSGEYSVNVPKGYYIVKVGDTIRKFVIN